MSVVNRLTYAAASGQLDIVNDIITTGDSSLLESPNVWGDTILMYASNGGHLEVVKALIATGLVDPGRVNKNGTTALIFASNGGYLEIVKVLIATGLANPGYYNAHGETALMSASSEGHLDIVKILLETGQSNAIQATTYGKTALLVSLTPTIRKVILKHLVLKRVEHRRRLAFHYTRRWTRSKYVGAPGSNQFFYSMGRAIHEDGLTTFEALQGDYPGVTAENYRFYLNA